MRMYGGIRSDFKIRLPLSSAGNFGKASLQMGRGFSLVAR